MKRKWLLGFVFLFLLCSLSGCWDLTEIEDIGFITVIGLDPVSNEVFESKTGKRKLARQHEYNQLFSASYNVAIPSKIEAQEGGREGRAFFTITTKGLTNFGTVRQIAPRRSRRLSFEHLEAIIINESLLRSNTMIEHLVDFYIRDHEMRRRKFIFVTTENTQKLINNKLPLEELISKSIVDISENHNAVLFMVTPKTLGEVSTDIVENHSFIIPRITASPSGDLKISGGAVFLGRKNHMVGWMGGEDTKGYNWVIGKANNSIVEVEYQGDFFVFEVNTMDSRFNYSRKYNQNTFEVDVRVEGVLAESWLSDLEINDESTIQKLEVEVENEIERQSNQIIQKMQNEFHTDVFEFYLIVRQKQYDYWKTVKDNWDGKGGAFKEAVVNVNASVKIRHYMLNEKLE